MSRLVDADAKVKELEKERDKVRADAEMHRALGNTSKYLSLIAKANDIQKHIKWLNELPTAYDVDKVMKELRKKANYYNTSSDEHQKIRYGLSLGIEIASKGSVE